MLVDEKIDKIEKKNKKQEGKKMKSNKKNTPYQELMRFLDQHRAISASTSSSSDKKGSKIATHTSISSPQGSYNIPSSSLQKFYNLYSKCLMSENRRMYLTEKHHEKYSPFLIDLDFGYKYDFDAPYGVDTPYPRQHTSEHISALVAMYVKLMRKMLIIPEDETIQAYVLERKQPYLAKRTRRQEAKWKDGVHIVFPNIITEYSVQEYIRERVISLLLSENDCFSSLPLYGPEDRESLLSDVIDKSVIKQNNWQMYGSTKPGVSDPYLLSYVLSSSSSSLSQHEEPFVSMPMSTLVKLFSIRIIPDSNIRILRTDTEEGRDVSIYHNERLAKNFSKKHKSDVRQGLAIRTPGETEEVLDLETQSLIQEMFYNECPSDDEADDKHAPDLRKYTLQNISELVSMLAPHRREQYDSWIRTLWCLKSIACEKMPNNKYRFTKHDRESIFQIFNKFSQTTEKGNYDGEDILRERWNNEKDYHGYKINTLYYWASLDDPIRYNRFKNKSITNRVMRMAGTGQAQPIAKIMASLWQYQHMCSDRKPSQWYVFENHRWQEDEDAHTLRNKLCNDLHGIFEERYRYFEKQLQGFDADVKEMKKKILEGFGGLEGHEGLERRRGTDEDQKTQLEKLKSKRNMFRKLIEKIESTTFENDVITKCKNEFYNKDFKEKLNQQTFLLGFTNGVYDLEKDEFREGRWDDFITQSTNYDYKHVDLNNPDPDERQNLEEFTLFISQVFPDPDLRRYVKRILGAGICGELRDEEIYYWDGRGGNGKSKLMDCLKAAIGDYCHPLNVQHIVGKKKEAGSANADYIKVMHARIIHFDEPDKGDKLNQGLLKNLSGGDLMDIRGLYERKVTTVKWQASFFILLNDLPMLRNGDDDGMKRRLRIIPFESYFTANPDPNDPKQFPIDRELITKIPKWRHVIFEWLLDGYREWYKDGLGPVPKCVREKTDYYFMSNDPYSEFLNDVLVEDNHAPLLRSAVLYRTFGYWYKENYPGRRGIPDKVGLERLMNDKYSDEVNRNARQWRGYRINWTRTDDYAFENQHLTTAPEKNITQKTFLESSDDEQ